MLLHSPQHYHKLLFFVTLTVTLLAIDKSISFSTDYVVYDENVSFASLSENAVCSDMFDVNQCLFIERAMGVVISNIEQKRKNDKINFDEQIEQFEEKRKKDKINFEEKLLKLRTQNNGMSYKISQLERRTSKSISKQNVDHDKYQGTISNNISQSPKNRNDAYSRYYTDEESWRKYLKENNLLNFTSVRIRR